MFKYFVYNSRFKLLSNFLNLSIRHKEFKSWIQNNDVSITITKFLIALISFMTTTDYIYKYLR